MPGVMPDVAFEWRPSPVQLQAVFDRVGDALQATFMADLARAGYGDDVNELMRERTRQGTDSSGQRFTPYAPLTVAIRRQIYGLGSSVDLTVSGRLLESLEARLTNVGLQLFFKGTHHGGVSNAQLAEWQIKGTSARGVVVLSGDRLIGIPGMRVEPGIPARNFVGLRPSDEVLATAVAQRVFDRITVPRLVGQLATALA